MSVAVADSPNIPSKASKSSFYTAMRLMPKLEREAMFAIYDFCRRVDDIADDGVLPRDQRGRELDAWREDLAKLYEGREAGRAAFLADVVRRYRLERDDFLAVIDGMQMDVTADIVAPDYATLDLYCDRVASAVGRLSVKVFGMAQQPGVLLSHHLGRALQLTNILRDVDEDAEVGRLYLPREFLDESGVIAREPKKALSDPRIDKACRLVAAKAHGHYDGAEHVFATRPQGNLMAPKVMGAVYGRILVRMEQDGWRMPRGRVKLPKLTMLWIILRHGLSG